MKRFREDPWLATHGGWFSPLMVASIALLFAQCSNPKGWKDSSAMEVPKLEHAPVIDGDLSEWKDLAFSDGSWDIDRLRHAPWFDSTVNRLTNHGERERPEDDLTARYYIAWDDRYLYLGAEVHDNVNDIVDPRHEPKRWYFKDAVCWFIEAPKDEKSENFAQGDNAFCFVIDSSMPSYGAWWRHGDDGHSYLEEPLPATVASYALRMNPWGRSRGDFILEARVQMDSTLAKSDSRWRSPRIGDVYGLEIVHTDPDGGDYGGHFLIYGKGDDDLTWGTMKLVGPVAPLVRKRE
jgi:hypothetical protein